MNSEARPSLELEKQEAMEINTEKKSSGGKLDSERKKSSGQKKQPCVQM